MARCPLARGILLKRRRRIPSLTCAIAAAAALLTGADGAAATGDVSDAGSANDTGSAIVEAPEEENMGAMPRRLQTSQQCRVALDGLVNDPNWKFWNASERHWCRLRLENEFAVCCETGDFAKGTAEGCGDTCIADCRHTQLMQQCGYFGQACLVKRKPFVRTGIFASARPSDAERVEVHETFCVPNDCNNGPDRDALMGWFNLRYRELRYGWTANYDEAVLECPSGVVAIIMITLACVVFVIACAGLCCFLCISPKERGKTLINQADMNAGANNTVEPMDQSRNMMELPAPNADQSMSGSRRIAN